MTAQGSAFESGFLRETEATTKRAGEYHLGDAAGEILAQQVAPEMQFPDEMTIKRRMRALSRNSSRTDGPGWYRTRTYPLAAAAVLILTVTLLVTQYSVDQGHCGRLNDLQVLSCGADHAQIFASIQQAYPGDTLLLAMRDRPAVAVPVNQLAITLNSAGAKFVIFQTERQGTVTANHGLVLTTLSESEFDTVQGSLAELSITRSVAQELARIKEQDKPNWDGTSPHHSVVSLVNIN